ncbi:MAG: hypothetical protein DWQ47_03745 [Acidobacteria bacterium]|mgnify:CR=1 FL=1|nr:MAG: hypothetical protein DWQ32_07295 [Acidobacteriota bacterium]REK01510.1 MAG: hypothetical protein DWQ38_03730 [Acidobacteriota bacterium]REK14466.1 MAG: hypothetical protein DWQ43_12985 [Acidobacteriota bacterium]REK45181.1 MAG: hypothetical protein DWQ47_03745 [Acidobacteriota bacterium]
MKWLIILLLFLVLIAVVAWYFRKYLQSAWFLYQTFRRMRKQMRPPQEKQVEPKSRSGDTELVRCPKCNKWTPKEEAVKLKSDFFCSLTCLEESVTFNKRA